MDFIWVALAGGILHFLQASFLVRGLEKASMQRFVEFRSIDIAFVLYLFIDGLIGVCRHEYYEL